MHPESEDAWRSDQVYTCLVPLDQLRQALRERAAGKKDTLIIMVCFHILVQGCRYWRVDYTWLEIDTSQFNAFG